MLIVRKGYYSWQSGNMLGSLQIPNVGNQHLPLIHLRLLEIMLFIVLGWPEGKSITSTLL